MLQTFSSWRDVKIHNWLQRIRGKCGYSNCITPRRGFMYNSLVYSWWSCSQKEITVDLYMYMIFDIFYVGGKQDFEPNSSTRKSRCVADRQLSKKPLLESCHLRQYSFSPEIGGWGHPPEDMNSATECAFLWRWQMLKSPWLLWFSVEWYRHTVLCILPFAWEVKAQRQSEMVFYHVTSQSATSQG